MQATSPEIRENGQNQSLHHKETRYSAEDVRLILDRSLTDSTVSETGSEDEQSSDIDSSTEYDLSDPEAGLNTEDDEFCTRRPVGKAATNWADSNKDLDSFVSNRASYDNFEQDREETFPSMIHHTGGDTES